MRGIINLVLGALLALGGSLATPVRAAASLEQYTLCTFRPQAANCDQIYKQALTDSSPGAMSVRTAFKDYGQYVRNARGALTEEDKQHLNQMGISLPPDLTAEDGAGLHALINDPAFRNSSALRMAVNSFLSRAVQAELYCAFNACPEASR